MKLFYKTLFVAVISLLLSACSHTNRVHSGYYQRSEHIRFHDLNTGFLAADSILQVNTREPGVVIIQSAQNKPDIRLQAKVLPKARWQENCQTNLSYEILETWELTGTALSQPIYLLAGCFDGNSVYMTSSLNHDLFPPSLEYKQINAQ